MDAHIPSVRPRRRRLAAVAAASALALLVAGCGGDSGDESGDNGGASGGTMVFGASSDPVIIDGAFVSDGESIRVVRQIFEGLVTTEEGGTEPVPLLAKEWTTSDDGLEWTFTLQDGVKFSDGTDFNGDAVCADFDRWYNFKGIAQSQSLTYYWQTVFGGFSDGKAPSLYKSCASSSPTEVTISLTKPSSTFLSALTQPSFAFASPTALETYKADDVTGTGDAPRFNGTFGTEHPIGTGPFTLESWQRGDNLTLARNEDYWGDKAKLDKLVLRPIAEGPDRRQALEAGDIDGYDLVDPSDIEPLKANSDFQVLERPAFNVGYVGFNQAIPPLDNLKVRQAIAYALNRERLLTTKYPEGAEVAKEFMPPELFGYADDVTDYSYDVDKAKQLLAESGVSNPTITFWYPSDVSRPYMPDPVANFQSFQSDLEAAGFTVKPKAGSWDTDYLQGVDEGKAQVYLLGWTGDYGDPDNFIGTFFQTQLKQWGWDDAAVRDLLDQAEAESDQDARITLYQDANKKIMEALPGLPYVHTKPALAFKASVKGYDPSPVQNETFATVSVN